MSGSSRSPSRDRSIRTVRSSYRDAPYRRDFRWSFRRTELCKNCRRPGHYARECPNVAVCNNCSLPGRMYHKSPVLNCKEPGHMASQCPNEGICHTCGQIWPPHDCTAHELPPETSDLQQLLQAGHIAPTAPTRRPVITAGKTGHPAHDCPNEPVCTSANISGHVMRHWSWPTHRRKVRRFLPWRRRRRRRWRWRWGLQDIVCRNCNQVGHMSRECMGALMICHNCGGFGHLAYECPSVGSSTAGPPQVLMIEVLSYKHDFVVPVADWSWFVYFSWSYCGIDLSDLFLLIYVDVQ
ncbi:hypothetical protein HPP92_006802 [Vanilla planifolia]|uniref:CCHC-type domain-containing protein n=1 Tax=Vanilla planifolia TaxID=51239 RepID=A0A835V741_VANPL|nr:hypothetical protein HPP92_006802 [Vanilla planifolia]